MATIAVQQAAAEGIALALSAAAGGGDSVANVRGRTIVAVRNGDASPKTVTIPNVTPTRPAEGPFPAMTVPDIVKVVAAGETVLIGPIPQAYNDASGNVALTYSAVTSVTVGAFEVI